MEFLRNTLSQLRDKPTSEFDSEEKPDAEDSGSLFRRLENSKVKINSKIFEDFNQNEILSAIQEAMKKLNTLNKENLQLQAKSNDSKSQITELLDKSKKAEESHNETTKELKVSKDDKSKLSKQVQQLNQDISKLSKENNDLQSENGKKNDEIDQLKAEVSEKIDIISAQTTNLELEKQQVSQLKEEKKTFQINSTTSNTKYSEEYNKIKDQLQESNRLLNEMEKQKLQLEDDLKKQKLSFAKLSLFLKESRSDLQDAQSEIGVSNNKTSDLSKQIQELETNILKISNEKEKIEQITDSIEHQFRETVSGKPPSLSIKMDSLLDLNNPEVGWKFETQDPEKLEQLMKKKMVTLAVIGMYDVGKSWFCNEFTGTNNYTSGYNQRTDGLNIVFPEEEGTLVGVIDTPGSNEAIRVTDKDLVEKIDQIIKDRTEDSKNKIPEDEYMQRYKILKNDAKMLQTFKEKFISRNS